MIKMNKIKKKIGILTQPLHDNYGGLLQAYALKETLSKLGHEVIIINRRKVHKNKLLKIAGRARRAINLKSLRRSKAPTIDQKRMISQHTLNFIYKYIPEQSSLITKNSEMNKLNYEGFDVFIVGSDQCWRPIYSPKIENYFLDFAKKNKHVKRLSYAASFGTDSWEFTDKQTKKAKNLLKKFDAISVRENTAIDLIKKNLSRDDAVHVLDPTLLLTKDEYAKLLTDENLQPLYGNLNVYVLDKSKEKITLINEIERKLKLKKFEVLPEKRLYKDLLDKQNILKFQFPSPLLWIKGFNEADFVITDSFHGTVFSILFNVPFICLGNKHRGMARFESLLSLFNLSDRLISDFRLDNIDSLLKSDIDWSNVNKIIEQERVKSLQFITESLD